MIEIGMTSSVYSVVALHVDPSSHLIYLHSGDVPGSLSPFLHFRTA